jgi:TatA/E family protein of Tat protein translocase
MFGGLSVTEVLVILVIALIIFGPRKLPSLGKTIGQSLAQFRRASEDFKRSWEEEVQIEEKRMTPAVTSYEPSAYEPPAPTEQEATPVETKADEPSEPEHPRS